MLTPLNLNNDDFADIWDMEMVAETASIQPKLDTVKKIDSFQKNQPPTAPSPAKQKNKESALNPNQKKKKNSSK